MFQVYERFDLRDVTPPAFWNDHEQSASFLELEAMSTGAYSSQRRSADDLTEKSSRIDCAAWLHWFENQVEEAYESSGGNLEIIADILEAGLGTREFIEYIASLPVQVGVFGDGPFTPGNHRQQLMRYLEQLATRMGLRCPETIACAAVLVIERTIQWARTSENSDAAKTARLLFQCLQKA